MSRGCRVCMLALCVVLMDGAEIANAQQVIGLRSSLDGNANAPDPTRLFENSTQDAPNRVTLGDLGGGTDVERGALDEGERRLQTQEQRQDQRDGGRRTQPFDLQPPPGGADDIDRAYEDSALIAQPPDGGIPPLPEAERQRRFTNRPQQPEPYDPLGLRIGAFYAYPSVEVTGLYSDNVQQRNRNRQSDAGLRIAPELRLQSEWVRHSYTLTGNGDFVFYAGESDYNDTTASINSDLLLNVRHTTDWRLVSTYNLTQTGPANSEVPDSASGQRTDQEFEFTSTLTHRFGRLVGRLTTGVRYLLFDDVELSGGGEEDNSDRNYYEPSIGARLTYEHTPAIRPFAEARYTPRFHEREVDRSGLRRDSHGGTLATGVEFDLSPIWSGEVAVRYDVRDYEDSSLETVHSVGLDGNVVWRPTRLTTVRWTAASTLDESADTNVSGVRNYDGNVEIEHALRENLVVTASGGLSYADRVGSREDEVSFDLGLGVSYRINRQAEILARFTASAGWRPSSRTTTTTRTRCRPGSGSGFEHLLQRLAELRAEVFALQTVCDIGHQEAEFVAAVVGGAVELEAMEGLFGHEADHGVGDLNFAARARVLTGDEIEDLRLQDVSA